ncbi:unnamed protein product [Cuscuta campestris]|uniref:Ribosomal RNA-processing protein 17 n=1 Tax=Cuscuta campestris TaxID=132261 RepID=A0A484LYN0_9ASTE|nr:unnamed protein product [Cuscuta campestris]
MAAAMAKGSLDEEDYAERQEGSVQGRHIKKRALKNKSLSISFDEKDLREFVTGFHKRKKKRRKEAQQKLQEADRRKRIEIRKERRLERQLVADDGVLPDSTAEPGEHKEDAHEDNEDEMESDCLNPLVSGTTMYDHGDVQITVTTSEITPEMEDTPALIPPHVPSGEIKDTRRKKIPVSKKKPFKKAAKKKTRAKPLNKRDRKKGKVANKMH